MAKTPKGDKHDPKGLIFEAYRIDGITSEECRSIFLDWALSLPEGQTPQTDLQILIDRHAVAAPDHPMTAVLREGQANAARPKRRGGWRARRD